VEAAGALGGLVCSEGDVAKYDGFAWNCESSPLGPLVVRDFNGELVGPILELSGFFVTVAVQMEVAGVPRIFSIQVEKAGLNPDPRGFLYSEDDSCGEPLFKTIAGQRILETAIIHDGIAYISEAGSGPVSIFWKSQVNLQGVCSPPQPPAALSNAFPVVSAVLPAFVPPFSAEF